MNDGRKDIENSDIYLNTTSRPEEKIVVPVIEEEIKVTKKFIDTARINLYKTVNENIESFQIPLSQEEIVVNRVPKNELVDTMPAASRYEGNVMIISVLKEVAVIEKRIMLVEEIHISKLKTEKTEALDVVVRKEEVNITRTELTSDTQ